MSLTEGAYYKYTPESRHAREGYAVACRYVDTGELYLADTFWELNGRSAGFSWSFSEAELATAEFIFNPNSSEWREVTVNDLPADYEPSDQQTITSQHGHRRKTWLRVGAEPSDKIKLANLTNEVREAEQKLQSAVRSLTYLSDRRAVLIHEIMRKEKAKESQQ